MVADGERSYTFWQRRLWGGKMLNTVSQQRLSGYLWSLSAGDQTAAGRWERERASQSEAFIAKFTPLWWLSPPSFHPRSPDPTFNFSSLLTPLETKSNGLSDGNVDERPWNKELFENFKWRRGAVCIENQSPDHTGERDWDRLHGDAVGGGDKKNETGGNNKVTEPRLRANQAGCSETLDQSWN